MDDKQFREHLQKMLEKDLRDQGLTTLEVLKRDKHDRSKQRNKSNAVFKNKNK